MSITSSVHDITWMGEVIGHQHTAYCDTCGVTWWEPTALDLAAVLNAHQIERHR